MFIWTQIGPSWVASSTPVHGLTATGSYECIFTINFARKSMSNVHLYFFFCAAFKLNPSHTVPENGEVVRHMAPHGRPRTIGRTPRTSLSHEFCQAKFRRQGRLAVRPRKPSRLTNPEQQNPGASFLCGATETLGQDFTFRRHILVPGRYWYFFIMERYL